MLLVSFGRAACDWCLWWGSVCGVYTMKVKVLVAQSCPTLSSTLDCRLLESSLHGVPQERILEWVSIPSSRDRLDPWLEPGFPALQASD